MLLAHSSWCVCQPRKPAQHASDAAPLMLQGYLGTQPFCLPLFCFAVSCPCSAVTVHLLAAGAGTGWPLASGPHRLAKNSKQPQPDIGTISTSKAKDSNQSQSNLLSLAGTRFSLRAVFPVNCKTVADIRTEFASDTCLCRCKHHTWTMHSDVRIST